MSEALVPAVTRPPVARTGSAAAMALPAVIVDAGPVAVELFLEFFAGSIANRRTRAAYGRAVGQFLSWCAARGLGLGAIAPLHVAAYIRTHPGSAPTVKQHLAAIRVLCDWLVVHQVLPVNPAAAVRGPKHVVTKGATPVLTPAETRSLLDGIDPGTLVGLRDRALLSVMVYSFARVSAVVGMRRQDYFRQGVRMAAAAREGRQAARRAGPSPGRGRRRSVSGRQRDRGREGAVVSECRAVGPLSERSVADAARGAVDDQAPCGGRGSAGVDVLTHVQGDGPHGVSVERGYARARATDCRPRVAEDDEAVRPDGGHGHARRDRTHRDLTGARTRPAWVARPSVTLSSPALLGSTSLALAPGSSVARSPLRLSALSRPGWLSRRHRAPSTRTRGRDRTHLGRGVAGRQPVPRHGRIQTRAHWPDPTDPARIGRLSRRRS